MGFSSVAVAGRGVRSPRPFVVDQCALAFDRGVVGFDEGGLVRRSTEPSAAPCAREKGCLSTPSTRHHSM